MHKLCAYQFWIRINLEGVVEGEGEGEGEGGQHVHWWLLCTIFSVSVYPLAHPRIWYVAVTGRKRTLSGIIRLVIIISRMLYWNHSRFSFMNDWTTCTVNFRATAPTLMFVFYLYVCGMNFRHCSIICSELFHVLYTSYMQSDVNLEHCNLISLHR